MTVVCLANCAFLSETSRMLAVHQALCAQGARSILATHGGTYEFVLQREGVKYECLPPPMSSEMLRKYVDANVDFPPRGSGSLVAELEQEVRAEMEFYRTAAAEVVVTGFTLSATLSARAAGIPLVVTHAGSWVPPVFQSGRADCAQVFDRGIAALIPDAWVERALAALLPRMTLGATMFRQAAKNLGIEPVRGFWDLMLGDLTLVTDVPEILGISEQEMEAWRPPSTKYFRPSARLRYAGAIFATLSGDVPKAVRSFLTTDRPKIYVALSTSQRGDVQHVYDTLATMDVRAIIAATVHDRNFGRAENIHVTDFLPSHRVMPLCDVAIIHGGQGSVQTAIASGTPIIGFPLQPEQNFNLRQVERHGGGRCLSLRQLRGGKLRLVIEDVLADESYRRAMRRLQQWQAMRDGPRQAAKAITEIMEQQAGAHA